MRRVAVCLSALVAVLASAGCTTTGTNVPSDAATPAPAVEKAIPADIKQILVAGGLDASNPSAPASRPATIASAALETQPLEELVSTSATPPSSQVLMAARSPTPIPVQMPKPASPASKPDNATQVLLAAVDPEKRADPKPQISYHVTSYAPVEIERPNSPPIRLASIDATAGRAAVPEVSARQPAARPKAFKPAPAPTRTVERQETTKIRRF